MSEIIKAPVIERDEFSHKGTFGTALLVTGSYGMAGASILAARSCLKSGVGIAKLLLPASVYPIVTSAVPECVCLPTGLKFQKTFGLCAVSKAKKEIHKVNSILIGCGMSQSAANKNLLKFVIKNAACPVIVDADGINMLSHSIDILREAKASVILTPHPKEMSRLTGKTVAVIENNREQTASDFAKEYGVYLVLKGHETVVAAPSGETYINHTGNSGMATGGSGDTLSGIMAARLAYEKDVLKAVCDSVYIHGLCGDLAAEKLSKSSMLPGDMIEELPFAFKKLEG